MAGILLPGMKAHIVRKDGSEADFGETKELFPGGPNAAVGSMNDETSHSETFTPDGCLKTGDGFLADEQGRFL
jgi:acyl-coenzyme A synthetase/AMP-(fatty) acid ligase